MQRRLRLFLHFLPGESDDARVTLDSYNEYESERIRYELKL